MKLIDYLDKVRGNRALSKFEAKLFGIKEMGKGWVRRYADTEITDEMVEQLIQNGFSAKKMKRKVKNDLLKEAEKKEKYKVSDDKLLYVMKNSRGDLKIGISIDPIKRARALTTGSGSTTVCLAAWKLTKNSRVVESELLKLFQEFRKEGEWFTPRAFSIEDVEANIPCGYKRVHTGRYDTERVRVETEEYEFLHIKHETQRASLFAINGVDVWVPKSKIMSIDSERHVVTVPIGQISDKLKAICP